MENKSVVVVGMPGFDNRHRDEFCEVTKRMPGICHVAMGHPATGLHARDISLGATVGIAIPPSVYLPGDPISSSNIEYGDFKMPVENVFSISSNHRGEWSDNVSIDINNIDRSKVMIQELKPKERYSYQDMLDKEREEKLERRRLETSKLQESNRNARKKKQKLRQKQIKRSK